MSKTKVTMIVFNTFNPDIRVLKEARSLKKVGYEVVILALKKAKTSIISEEVIDGIKIVRHTLNPWHYRFLQSIKNTVKSMTRATNLTKKYIKGHIKNTVKSMTRAANLTKKYIKGYILGVGFQEKKNWSPVRSR